MASPYNNNPGYGQQQPPPGMQGGYGAPGGYGQPPPPAVDPQVMGWFQAVDNDRSGRISVTELQQALTNANWSHFNPETVRLMIGMFDRDHSGQIDVNEFQALWAYIHQWKGVFDQFDRDRSGQIDSNELHNAFNQMGYRLSPQFAQMVVTRYDVQARRTLTLDNFIQSCVMLKAMTDQFRQKDINNTGSIQISYEECLSMVILNKP